MPPTATENMVVSVERRVTFHRALVVTIANGGV